MRNLSNPVEILKEEAENFPAEVRITSLGHAAKSYREAVQEHGPGPTGLRLALEAGLATLKKTARAEMRKSEVESSAVYSNDFNYPPTPGQAAAAATEALQMQGLRQALGRQVQATNPGMAAEDVMAIVNVAFTSFEGEDGQTTVHSNPQVAARLHELPADGTIWMDMSAPSQMARPPIDEDGTNFAGVTNPFGYTSQRSELGASTGFSGSGGTSVPSGTSEGATVAQLSAAALSAAYSAGVAAASRAAGSRGVAKARRSR